MPQHEVELILKAVSDLRGELTKRIDRLDDKFTTRMDNLDRNGCARSGQHDDIEKRVRVLEMDRARIAGIVAAVSVAASCIAWLVSHVAAIK